MSHEVIALETGKFKCPFCDRIFAKKFAASNHVRYHFGAVGPTHGKTSWKKGLTKETDPRVKKSAETYKQRINNGEITFKRSPHTAEAKKKMSESRKAWLATHSISTTDAFDRRRHGKASYAEEFFLKVILSEFSDKNVVTELGVGRYWLDFAWIEKMRCIEIDGSQHLASDRKASDQAKDQFLIEAGWTILRISWVDLFHDSKTWIAVAKEFIDSGEIIPVEQRWVSRAFQKEKRKQDFLSKGYSLDSTGKRVNFHISPEEIARRTKLLYESEIDFSKFGWVQKAADLIGIHPQKLGKFMNKYMKEFYETKCFHKSK